MVRDGFLLSYTLKVNIFVVGCPSSPQGCARVSVMYACTYLCQCMYVHVCVAVTYGAST